MISLEERAKCKSGELDDNYFFEKAGLEEVKFESSPNQSDCYNKGEPDRLETFKGTHKLIQEKLKGSDIDLVKLCDLTKLKYREMEKNRRQVVSACSNADTPKCQIADANGNCPGSEEAKAFVIEKPEEVKVVAGSNSLENKLQRIRADKKKCKEERDPYACGRLRSRGGKGFGK